jgi:chemotaxis response regulator CheB
MLFGIHMADLSHQTLDFERRSEPAGIVAIVGSAGGIEALLGLLRGLPSRFPLPIIVVQHLARGYSNLVGILARHTDLEVQWLDQNQVAQPNTMYVVRPGQAAAITPAGFTVSTLPDYARAWLPSPDDLLTSIAHHYGSGAVVIVLAGAMPVGIDGLRAIRRCGGLVMAQKITTAAFDEMPAAAIDFGKAEIISCPAGLARALWAMVA